jgi:hypothetical protein
MDNQNGRTDHDASIDLEIKKATLDKLRAETGQVNRQLSLRMLLFVPMLTVFLTFISLIGGGVTYFNDREEARVARENETIRSYVNRLLSFPAKTDVTTPEVIYISKDLYNILTKHPTTLANVSEAIAELVDNQIDYENTRNVILLRLLITHWPPLQNHVADVDTIRFITYRLTRALQKIASEDAEYFKLMKYDSVSRGYQVEYYTEEARYLHFLALVGTSQAVIRAANNRTIFEEFRQSFSRAVGNEPLAKALFSDYAALGREPH